jgi:hypothetical protein
MVQVCHGRGKGGCTELLWDQQLNFSIGHEHRYLTQGCADVSQANFVCLWVANASSGGHDCLQEVPEHRLGCRPSMSMRLQQMSDYVAGSHVLGLTELTYCGQLKPLVCCKASRREIAKA